MSRRKPPPTEPLTLGPFPLHRFLSPDEIQSGIAEVVDVATREGIDIVLVGGVAMQVYGSNRLTGNIDFAATKVLSLPSLRVLPFGGIATETPSGIPVHVIVRNDDYRTLFRDVLARSPLLRERGVRVASPEHLVALAMAAYRSIATIDLKSLLAREGVVDITRARTIVRKFLGPYAVLCLDRYCDEIAFEKATGRR